ncbi:MAG TPA: DNA cytosine methyltransferase [Gallionella sp.]|nr:DNA cytosine methyltransferase [Gallionella sp.]
MRARQQYIFPTRPLAIDLFCGCGGMTEGLKQAGFKVLWGIDVAASPLTAYRANHPEVLVDEKDIRKIECKYLMRTLNLKKGELDLLAGCPPCQGFSTMRTNNGRYSIPDERNNLINDYLRFVEAFLPKAVMLENVPGLKDDPRFDIFVATMSGFGYQGEWKVLNVADYGVPQRRRRLIYVAAYRKSICISDKKYEYRSVRDAIGSLPLAGKSGDFMHDIPEKRTKKIQEMIALIPKNGGSRSQLPAKYVLPCHIRNPGGFKDVYGRMDWDKPSPTITGGCASPSKGRFLHPEENRCITPREASLLQGFPPNYFFPRGLSKDQLALMVGNALPVPFIYAHATEIRQQMKKW